MPCEFPATIRGFLTAMATLYRRRNSTYQTRSTKSMRNAKTHEAPGEFRGCHSKNDTADDEYYYVSTLMFSRCSIWRDTDPLRKSLCPRCLIAPMTCGGEPEASVVPSALRMGCGLSMGRRISYPHAPDCSSIAALLRRIRHR